MREFYFEKLIQEKLQNMKVPFNPEDWKLMESLLDTVMEVADDSQTDSSPQKVSDDISLGAPLLSEFDKEIAKKLHSIDEPVPNDWELFASELDNELFDQAIREKIEEVPVDQNPVDWHTLESKLDGHIVDAAFRKKLLNFRLPFYAPDWLLFSEVLNRPFDQSIREKLSGLTLGMNAGDWQIMSRKLATTPDIVSTLPWYQNWKNYVSSASIMIILFLSISWADYLTNRWEGEIQYVEYFTPDNQFNLTEAKNNFSDSPPIVESSITEARKEMGNPVSETVSASQVKKTNITQIQNFASDAEAQNTEYLEKNTYSHSPAPTSTPTPSNVAESKSTLDISVSPLHGQPEEGALDFTIHNRGIHKIEPLWQGNNPELRIGVFGGSTSSMVELSDPGESGYMGGLRLELVVNQEFSIVTGLNYNLRNITYDFQLFTPRRLDQTLEARLEMVELPILFRYNFPTQNRLHLYAQAGVITAVSIVEDYRAISSSSSPFNQSQARPAGPIDERKYNTYVGNIYAAAGFEYQLNSSLAFQIEPYFQMNMQKTKGVGALGLGFEKQIYTAGVGLGLLYSLKKREKP
jgi:hypothetical protein